MDEEMAKYPGLSLRGSTYQLRKRVPEDVRMLILNKLERWRTLSVNPGSPLSNWNHLVQGKGSRTSVRSEVTRSLRTKDFRSAKTRYYEAALELDNAFELIRNALADYQRTPTDEELRGLCFRHFQLEDREQDTKLSDLSLQTEDRNKIRENLHEDLATHGAEDPIATQHFLSLASNLLHAGGFADQEVERSKLGGFLRRADELLIRRNLARVDQQAHDLPTDATLFANASTSFREQRPSPSLRDAFDTYRKDKKSILRHYKTAQKYDHLWLIMSDVFGPDTSIAAITRTDARRFIETVERLPPHWQSKKAFLGLSVSEVAELASRTNAVQPAQNTVRGKIDYLSSFLSWAEQEGYVDKNAAKGLARSTGHHGKRSARRSFSDDDLRAIFSQDYPSLARLRGASKPPLEPAFQLPTDVRYWAPLISLFTGMRLSEICQLTKGEFTTIEDVECILAAWDLSEPDNIDTEEEISRSRKTEAAPRAIPIVPELKNLGLLELVNSIDGGPSQRIFPDLRPDKRGFISPPVSRWFARYKTNVGVTDTKKVFHSFRHTFRDALSNAGVSHEVVVSVGGWAKRDQSDDYGSGGRVRRAQRELLALSYPGLDLGPFHRRG